MSFVVSFLAVLAVGQAQTASAETPSAPQSPAAVSSGGASTGGAPAKAKRGPADRPSLIKPNTTDQIFENAPITRSGATSMRGDSMATMSMNRLADQRILAKKAATMINAGHCPEALQLVVDKGDGLLAGNVARACGLPEPTMR